MRHLPSSSLPSTSFTTSIRRAGFFAGMLLFVAELLLANFFPSVSLLPIIADLFPFHSFPSFITSLLILIHLVLRYIAAYVVYKAHLMQIGWKVAVSSPSSNVVFREMKPVAGALYAIAPNGMELPIIDLTNPVFEETHLTFPSWQALIPSSRWNWSWWMKYNTYVPYRWLGERSFIGAGCAAMRLRTKGFFTGLATYIMKLGPRFVGTGRDLDKILSSTIFGIAHRQRLLSVVEMMASACVEPLSGSHDVPLHLMAFAGGPCTELLNTLLVLADEKKRELLEGRKIILTNFDRDSFGSKFALSCLTRLMDPSDGPLAGLDIKFHATPFNWNSESDLSHLPTLLRQHAPSDSIRVIVSEGGIFTYAKEPIISTILSHIRKLRNVRCVVGTVAREEFGLLDVLKAVSPHSRISSAEGIGEMVKESGWKVEKVSQGGDMSDVFSLEKRGWEIEEED